LSKVINSIVYYSFFVLTIFIVGASTYNIITFANGVMRIALVIGIAAMIALLIYFAPKIGAKLGKLVEPISARRLLIILIVMAVITKIGAALIFQINSQMHPDVKEYVSYAKQLIDNGCITQDVLYAYKVPKAIIFGMSLMPCVKFFGTNPLALSIYVSIWQIVTLCAFYSTIKYLLSKKIAFFSMLIWVLLPTEIFLPQYTIHEQALLLFNAITIWLFFKVLPCTGKTWQKIIVVILGAVSLSIGTTINQLGMISAIAICVVFISQWFGTKITIKSTLYTVGKISVIVLAVFLIMQGSRSYAKSLCVMDGEDTKIVNSGYTWAFYVGMNAESNGQFALNDNIDFKAKDDILPAAQVKEYRNDLLKNRVTDLVNNPAKLSGLMWNKFNNIWGNTKYSLDYSNETIQNDNTKALYSKFIFKPLSIITCLTLCCLAVILLLSLKNKIYRKVSLLQYMMMFMIGFTLILLLVECNTKYVACFKIYFIITAIAGFKTFSELSEKITNKIFKRSKTKIEERKNDSI